MPEYVLKAELRSERGSKAAARLRRSGRVPAVLYGHKEAVQALAVPQEDFQAVVAAGAHMVDLRLGEAVHKVLIKEVQYDALGDEAIHVDFVRVALDETIRVTVPLEVHGTAAGVAEGGVMDLFLHDLEVECLPADIPEKVVVHVDAVGLGRVLRLGEVPLPAGVKAVAAADTAILAVHLPMVAPEPTPAEEGPVAPELIRKAVPEEEAEAAGEAEAEEK